MRFLAASIALSALLAQAQFVQSQETEDPDTAGQPQVCATEAEASEGPTFAPVSAKQSTAKKVVNRTVSKQDAVAPRRPSTPRPIGGFRGENMVYAAYAAQNAAQIPSQVPYAGEAYANAQAYAGEMADRYSQLYGGYPTQYVSDEAGDYVEGGGDFSYEGDYQMGAGGEYCPDAGMWANDHPSRIWAGGDLLWWRGKGDILPPLVTSSPAGTPQDQAGVLGLPSTTILFGNQRVNNGERFGGRVNLGFWLAGDHSVGLEGQFWTLETEATAFAASSSGDPILARPFFNTQTGVQDRLPLAFPGLVVDPFRAGATVVNLSGGVYANAVSEVRSAGIIRRELLWGSSLTNYRFDILAGYRFFQMDETLTIIDSIFPSGFPFLPGTHFDSRDVFDVGNQFHGGDFGFAAQFRRGAFSVELMGKVGVGNNRQTSDIRGATVITVPAFGNTPQTSVETEGGLLAQTSNIGHHTRDLFVVIPETEIKFGLQVTRDIRATVGYNFTYFSNLALSGPQVDLAVNPSQVGGGTLVGEPRPHPRIEGSEYWLHGATIGIEVRR